MIKIKSQTIIGYLLSLIVVVAFSVYPSIAPLGLQSGARPFGFAFLAMLVSALGVASFALVRKEKLLPSKNELAGLLLISSIFLLEHVCLLYSLGYMQVAVAMSLIYTYPFMIAVIAILSGSIKASLQLLGCLSLCLLGIILVVGFSSEQLHLLGIVLALVQALMAACRILLTSHLLKKSAGLVLIARMLLCAIVLGLPLMLIIDLTPPQTLLGWVAVVIAGISGMIGHCCIAQALKRVDTTTFGIIMNLEPVFAALLSALILGQILNLQQYLGAVLVIVSVGLYGYLKVDRHTAI